MKVTYRMHILRKYLIHIHYIQIVFLLVCSVLKVFTFNVSLVSFEYKTSVSRTYPD
jgi:hypothetical protein